VSNKDEPMNRRLIGCRMNLKIPKKVLNYGSEFKNNN